MTNPFVQISQHPMVAVKISQLRDKDQSPKVVRELVHDLSSLLAYEATKDISLHTKDQIVCVKIMYCKWFIITFCL